MNYDISQRIREWLLIRLLQYNRYINLPPALCFFIIISRGHYHLEVVGAEGFHGVDGDVEFLKGLWLVLVSEAEENKALLIGNGVGVVDEELLVPGGVAAFDKGCNLEISFFRLHFVI